MNPEDIETSTAAMQWLAAQPGLSKSDLNLIGVSYRIKNGGKCNQCPQRFDQPGLL